MKYESQLGLSRSLLSKSSSDRCCHNRSTLGKWLITVTFTNGWRACNEVVGLLIWGAKGPEFQVKKSCSSMKLSISSSGCTLGVRENEYRLYS